MTNNQLEIINEKTKKPAELQIIKKDFTTKEALQGAVFSLYKLKDGFTDTDTGKFVEGNFEEVKNNLTTDVKGRIKIDEVQDGTYYLKEVKAPESYTNIKMIFGPISIQNGEITSKSNSEMYEISVDKTNDDKITNTVTIYNKKAVFPSMGGRGIIFIVLSGLIMMALSVIMYSKKRRNEIA